MTQENLDIHRCFSNRIFGFSINPASLPSTTHHQKVCLRRLTKSQILTLQLGHEWSDATQTQHSARRVHKQPSTKRKSVRFKASTLLSTMLRVFSLVALVLVVDGQTTNPAATDAPIFVPFANPAVAPSPPSPSVTSSPVIAPVVTPPITAAPTVYAPILPSTVAPFARPPSTQPAGTTTTQPPGTTTPPPVAIPTMPTPTAPTVSLPPIDFHSSTCSYWDHTTTRRLRCMLRLR